MRDDAAAAVRAYYRTILPFYEEENETRNDLEFWRGVAGECQPRNILELGAGTGRMTAALREFAPVVAIDLLPEMLERAAARLSGGHLFPVEWRVADMRNFALPQRFDLIVAADDPFSHLTLRREREMALRAVREHLAPGGRVVIEGLYRPHRIRFEVAERCANGVSVREEWSPYGSHDCWRARYYYRRGGERVEAEFRARAWNPAEVEELFASCGLKLRARCGDFERRAFAAGARRIILVGERVIWFPPFAQRTREEWGTQ
ncbi:MAG: class I SAM-dependent methyltransferase [Acidobacteriaceae bacterium]